MNDKRLYSVLVSPYNTEKTVMIGEKHKQIAFKVATDATKEEVRLAVKKLFEVDVEKVTMVRKGGKVKNFKQREGRRSSWKQAYVSLKPGQDINFANFQ